MTILKKILIITLIMTSFAYAESEPVFVQTKNIVIDSKLVDCYAPFKQKCMRIKDYNENEITLRDTNNSWKLFYGKIDGFKYKEGFTYTITIDKIKNHVSYNPNLVDFNPPLYTYTFKKLISRVADINVAVVVGEEKLNVKVKNKFATCKNGKKECLTIIDENGNKEIISNNIKGFSFHKNVKYNLNITKTYYTNKTTYTLNNIITKVPSKKLLKKQLKRNKNNILIVANKKVDCFNGEVITKCFLVKKSNKDKKYTYLYTNIDGLNYQEGYKYIIKVTSNNIDGQTKYQFNYLIKKQTNNNLLNNYGIKPL